MILILGSPSDPLAVRVQCCLEDRGQVVRVVSEEVLFSATSLALERAGTRSFGHIQFDGTELDLEAIDGVLLRLPRTWWPSNEFCLQDQIFVYHETMAAWYALLSSLRCPVVNRFGLGWWLRDASYPELLRIRLAERLGLDPPAGPALPPPTGDILSVAPGTSPGTSSVYVVGEALVPRSEQDTTTVQWLAPYARALSAWQQENGLPVCRLDLLVGQIPEVERVEAIPSFEGEPVPVLDRVAQATSELYS